MKPIITLILAALLCLLFCAAALAENANELTLCEYSILGGMENEHFIMTLDADGLTVADHDAQSHYTTTWDTLRDLQNYIAQYAPESWAALPYAEEHLLDAPSEYLYVEYGDGSAFSISLDHVQPKGSGRLMQDVYFFLKSYTKENAKTFTLTITTCEGIEMQETPVLSSPEILFVRTVKDYGPSYDPLETGSQYTETYEYHGRIPGVTELTINGFGTMEPIPVMDKFAKRAKYKVYTLTVDRDFNVTCKEAWRWFD
ncbi:MAG: hypothetical protein IJ157_10655 [Clostridia bacterium]|nr:hypothetical protein [Clostridia bacterium]